MKDLKPDGIVTRNTRRNANHKHPWMGLIIPNAKASTIRELLPVICRPVEHRACGPRDV